jgi:hypothetical protein
MMEYEKHKAAQRQNGMDRPLVDAWKKFEQAVRDLKEAVITFEFETGKNQPLDGYPFQTDLEDVTDTIEAYRERIEQGL